MNCPKCREKNPDHFRFCLSCGAELERPDAGEEALAELCRKYLDGLRTYALSNVPNERLMQAIEEKAGVSDGQRDAFRGELLHYVAALAIEGKTFDHRTHERLHRALALYLLET